MINIIVKKHLSLIKDEKNNPSWKDEFETRIANIEMKIFNKNDKAIHSYHNAQFPILSEAIEFFNEELIVERIIKYKKQGYTVNRIADKLNSQGLRTLRGKKFNFNSVQKQVMKIRKDKDKYGVDI